MNGGEPVLGGIKIPHGDTTAPDPGSQPALSDTNPVSDPPKILSAAPVSTVSQSPLPSTLASQPPLPPTPSPQPTQHSATPQPQANFSSFQANSQSTIPTNSPVGSATISQPIPRLTNRFSDHPIAEQPFPSPIPNSPTQGTVFNNSGNNIMLSPTPQPKKSKKGLIAAIIICLALLIIAGIAAYFITQSNNNAVIISNADTATLLNRYSNYLLYSQDNDIPIDYIDLWSKDNIEQILKEDEPNRAAYFGQLINLYNDFTESFRSTAIFTQLDEDDSKLINGLMANNEESLQTLSTYATASDIDIEFITNYYIDQGIDETTIIIEDPGSEWQNIGQKMIEDVIALSRMLYTAFNEAELNYEQD